MLQLGLRAAGFEVKSAARVARGCRAADCCRDPVNDPSFAQLARFSVLFELAAASVVLAARRGPRGGEVPLITWRRLAAAAGAGFYVLVLKFGLWPALDPFGAIHLIYLDLVVALPGLAAILLAADILGRRSRGPSTAGSRPDSARQPGPSFFSVGLASSEMRGLLIAALFLAPLGVWASHVEPRWLRLERAWLVCDAEPVRCGWARARGVERARGGTSGALASGAPQSLGLPGQVEPVDFQGQPREPLRLGVLADLQTGRVGDHERAAVQMLMAAQPELILFAGDLFQGSDEAFEAELPALRALLGQLAAPGGVFAVRGNVDGDERLERAAAGTPVRVLKNELAETEVAGWRVAVVGLDEPLRSGEDYDTALARLMPQVPAQRPGQLRVLLVHRPDVLLSLGKELKPGGESGAVQSRPDRRRAGQSTGAELPAGAGNAEPGGHPAFDLVVAGHTHGGQVRLPWFGPILTLSAVPRWLAAGGSHYFAGYPVYVSRGVGLERGQAPPVRLLCPPEVALVAVVGAE